MGLIPPLFTSASRFDWVESPFELSPLLPAPLPLFQASAQKVLLSLGLKAR